VRINPALQIIDKSGQSCNGWKCCRFPLKVYLPLYGWRALFGKFALSSRILPVFAQSGFWVILLLHQGLGLPKRSSTIPMEGGAFI
jgi:hypothetical protein